MKQHKFLTELKMDINNLDFTFLRLLYTPVIGVKAVALFSLFYDFNFLHKSAPTYVPFKELTSFLNISESQLIIERQKLEAVGLLRVFEKADNEHFIISIHKPLSPQKFRKNSLLFKTVISKIGEINFERVYFAQTPKTYDKNEFKDVTTKYQDLFSMQEEIKTKDLYLKSNWSFENIDAACKALNPEQLINFLTQKRLTPAQMGAIQQAQRLNFPILAINEIIHYSFLINNKHIVAQHINVIIQDLYRKNILTYDQIKSELTNAQKTKKTKIIEQLNSEDNNQKSSDESWDDLLNMMGGF